MSDFDAARKRLEFHADDLDRDGYSRYAPQELAADIRLLLAEVDRLKAELAIDREMCLCGCPASEHENYGEDGECCENEEHCCLRVCPAVASLFAAERERADRWQKGHTAIWERMESAVGHIETALECAESLPQKGGEEASIQEQLGAALEALHPVAVRLDG